MTIEEHLLKMLENHGLWDHEAVSVMQQVKASNVMEQPVWQHEIEGYPQSFLAVLWVATRQEAVTWIDENKPKHWARPMFVDGNR